MRGIALELAAICFFFCFVFCFRTIFRRCAAAFGAARHLVTPVQAVDEKLSELKSDPQNDAASTVRELDDLIQNAVKAGALAISTDADADADAMRYSSPDSAAKVRAAAAVLVRAKRQGEVKRLLRSQLQLSDGIAEHLAASGLDRLREHLGRVRGPDVCGVVHDSYSLPIVVLRERPKRLHHDRLSRS